MNIIIKCSYLKMDLVLFESQSPVFVSSAAAERDGWRYQCRSPSLSRVSSYAIYRLVNRFSIVGTILSILRRSNVPQAGGAMHDVTNEFWRHCKSSRIWCCGGVFGRAFRFKSCSKAIYETPIFVSSIDKWAQYEWMCWSNAPVASSIISTSSSVKKRAVQCEVTMFLVR